MSTPRQDDMDGLILANDLLREENEKLKQKLQEYEEREKRYNEFLNQRESLNKAMDDLYRVRNQSDILYKTNKPNVVATRDGFRTTKTTEQIIKEIKDKIHE